LDLELHNKRDGEMKILLFLIELLKSAAHFMRQVTQTTRIRRHNNARLISNYKIDVSEKTQELELSKSDFSEPYSDPLSGTMSISSHSTEEIIHKEFSIPYKPTSGLKTVNKPDSNEVCLNENVPRTISEDKPVAPSVVNHEVLIENISDKASNITEKEEKTSDFLQTQNSDITLDEVESILPLENESKEREVFELSCIEDVMEQPSIQCQPEELITESDVIDSPVGVSKIEIIDQAFDIDDNFVGVISGSKDEFRFVSKEKKKGKLTKMKEDDKYWNPFKTSIYFPDAHIHDEQLVEDFLENLKSDNLESVFSYDIRFLDYLFFRALARFDYIGDLPVSELAYHGLIDYLKQHATEKGKRNPRKSLPTIFVVSMVFCARYSETEAREFWKPYAQQVWGMEPSQSFQKICRELFIYSRQFIHQELGLEFFYNRPGEVVRPIYQHAIIPNHLKVYFSEWLVENYENLVEYPVEVLKTVLQYYQSIKYVPRSLANFLLGDDTRETAVRLINLMSNAMALFFEVEQMEVVESLFTSSIERAIWETIHKKLMHFPSQLEKSQKMLPRLNWIWDLEKDEILLKLSNIRSDKNKKPDSVTIAEKKAETFKNNPTLSPVFPWKMKSGNWELDPILVRMDSGFDGEVLVLSEDFDLDRDRLSQSDHIIFERSVPPLDNSYLVFEVSKHKNLATKKDKIDSDGDWIIVGKSDFKAFDKEGKELTGISMTVPFQLTRNGYLNAKLFGFNLPISVQYNNETTFFEEKAAPNAIDPIIIGEEKISGLSIEVPQVFSSDKVEFRFFLDSAIYRFHRTWLTIWYAGEFHISISLSELNKQGKMHISDNQCVVDLSTYIMEPGAYDLDLIYDMRHLLPEKLRFAWLPNEIEITGPKKDTCYSPVNPVQLSIIGVSENQILPDRYEKVKLTSLENGVMLEWKYLKEAHCGFKLVWNNSNIPFQWKIDRVFAWVQGGGDKRHVFEDQANNIELFARGKANENLQWIVGESAKTRNSKLDSKGQFFAKLNETQVRDMLLEEKSIISTVSIAMRNYQWKLFDYEKKPSIEKIRVKYENSSLCLSIDNARELFGDYKIQVRENSLHAKPLVLVMPEIINKDYLFKIELIPGTYKVEILANNSVIATSSEFVVEEDRKEDRNEYYLLTEEVDSPKYIFGVLTATKHQILQIKPDSETISAVLGQLKIIHDSEEWLIDRKWRDSFKRLLPAWAVLKHPLRFITNKHKRVLHVFPEKAIYGGKAGSGYLDLKLEGEKIKIVVDWKPKPNSDCSVIWMRIPQEENKEIHYFSELSDWDELGLWPAYQCVDCGEIVGSRNGNYLRLPPSTYRLHQHGKNRNLREQFFDTVYSHGKEETVDVSITQYDKEILSYVFSPKDVIFQNYLDFLINGKIKAKPGTLSQPIETRDNRDFGTAMDNLYENLDNPHVKEFSKSISDLSRVYKSLRDDIEKLPAFGPYQRLMEFRNEPIYPYNLPGSILTLAMLLRLKGNDTITYNELISSLEITEESLIQMTNEIAFGCPKMLEWAVAWTELFYVHSIS